MLPEIHAQTSVKNFAIFQVAMSGARQPSSDGDAFSAMDPYPQTLIGDILHSCKMLYRLFTLAEEEGCLSTPDTPEDFIDRSAHPILA